MTETLLSPSNVLLFGRKITDLKIELQAAGLVTSVDLATTHDIKQLNGHIKVDGVPVAAGNRILVKDQRDLRENGIWVVRAANQDWNQAADVLAKGIVVVATAGRSNKGRPWVLISDTPANGDPKIFSRSIREDKRKGRNRDLEDQLEGEGACFARIYGFSYEGTYYDLPRPALFLVHGDGDDPVAPPPAHVARGPLEPSLTGVAAANFQLAEDLKVWSYDKADYTIRLDVESGMFEDVLLDMVGGGGPGASGARVSGARVSGARVSGARVSGARLSGGRGDSGD